jgi:AI-2 transport protein TqsA
MSSSAITSGMLIFFGSVVVLIFGQYILIPLIAAVLVYFLIRYITKLFDRIAFVKAKVPRWFKNIVATLVLFSIATAVMRLIIYNFDNLIRRFPSYQANVEKILHEINIRFGIDLIQSITHNLSELNYADIANTAFNSLTTLFGNALMITFYVVFLFIEQSNFKAKIRLLFKGEQLESMLDLLSDTEHSVSQYIGLKTIISLITGAASYIVLLAFGVESAIFWAFLIFVLNYIPYVGSLAAVLFPFLFSLIQFGEFTNPLIMLFILGSIQMVIGNFLEPKLMGDLLNISPIVALVSLAFWGSIWGVIGMFISVPLTVILIIALAKIPKTRPIAILLSQNGRV